MDKKILQIGFNRCGTRSITTFFKNNNIKSLHWENGLIAKRIFFNLQNGVKLLDGLNAIVFTDMEWLVAPHFYFEAYKLFPLLYKQYPDAYFVLNYRNQNDWLKSRLNHFDGKYANRFMKTFGIDNERVLTEFWKKDWNRHHNRVRSFFSKNSANYFEFDLDSDGPEVFIRNIDFDFQNKDWPHVKGKQGW
tara:strand:- start:1340 stop:1912 length:573 start_codon:yes stop_codon:yes gene_type:complete